MFYLVWFLGIFLAVLLSAVVTITIDKSGKFDD